MHRDFGVVTEHPNAYYPPESFSCKPLDKIVPKARETACPLESDDGGRDWVASKLEL